LWIDDVHKVWKQNFIIPYGVIGLGAEFKFPTDIAVNIAQKANFFFVRDKYSLDCMHINNMQSSRDITFSDPLEWLDKKDVNTDNLFFVWRDGESFYKFNMNNFIEYGKYKDNFNVFDEIIKSEFKSIQYDNFQVYDDNIEELIIKRGFVISGRFHGIIAAIHKGLPCIAIDICPKIRAIMQDCGLEEYCIKMNEVDKLKNLIRKAKKEMELIREKQLKYRMEAIDIINKDIHFAQKEVGKYL
jgi:polysaccharide pyruvyl transferase WcaK-like protein